MLTHPKILLLTIKLLPVLWFVEVFPEIVGVMMLFWLLSSHFLIHP